MPQCAAKHLFWYHINFMFTVSMYKLFTVFPETLQKLLESDKNPLAASVWYSHGQNIKVHVRSGEPVSW